MEIIGRNNLNLENRPVERVIDSAFSKMRNLVDADVIVGTPIITADGASIIPVNRVTMGIVTGGGEYGESSDFSATAYPFAGGSGAGMTVSPMCFLISNGNSVKVINIDNEQPLEKLLGLIPETIGKVIKGVVSKDK